MSTPANPIDRVPEIPRLREAAAKLPAEDLAAALDAPETVADLAALARPETPKTDRLAIVTRLVERWAGPIPESAPEPSPILDASGKPYSQGKPLEKRKPRLITSAIEDIEAEEVDWLWPGRIPAGRVTVLMGRQGKGKSTLVSWLASTVSLGGAWPDSPDDNGPGGVIILQAEESASQDLRPRLDAFGFGKGRIQVIRGVERFDADGKGTVGREFNLGADVEILRAEIERRGDIRLVIVDPLGSYIRGISGYNDSEVRAYLDPLFAMAEETGVAVVLVAHPKKDQECDILDRCSGSGAFTQFARMSWYFSDDPRDESRRLLSLMKGNIRTATRTAIAVSLDKRSGRLVWHPDPVPMEAQQVDNLLQKAAREAKIRAKPGADPEKTRKAEDFILKQLGLADCSLSALKEKAQLIGLSFSTLRRAIAALEADDRKAIERYPKPPEDRTWFRLVAPAEAPAEGSPEGPPEGGETGPEGRAPNSSDPPSPPR